MRGLSFLLLSCLLITIIALSMAHADEAWEWKPMSNINAPSPRGAHVAVWTGTEMIIWGGSDASQVALGDGARYNPETHTWTPMSTVGAPSPREGCAAVWTGSELIIWGGASFYPVRGSYSDGYRYDPSMDTWASVSSSGAPSARRPRYCWTGSEMIIVGGDIVKPGGGYSTANDGALYNPITDSWSPMASFPLSGRHPGTIGVWTGDVFIIWGGKIPYQDWLRDGAYYDPSTDAWTTMTTNGAPSKRHSPAFGYYEGKLCAWGGNGPYTTYYQLGDGGIYDLNTDSWTPMSDTGAPSPRLSMAWAYTETGALFVWGGYSTIDMYRGDGAIYSIPDDTWTPMLDTGAPSPRTGASGVWTGESFIVWGGRGASGLLGDGKIYGPANVPPVADAGPDQTVLVCESAQFDGSGSNDPDGAIVSYEWDFGDGNTGSGQTVSHTYSSAGTYTVILTVTDDDDATDTDTSEITVLEAAFGYALFGNTGKMAINEYASVSGDVYNRDEVEIKAGATINGLLYTTEPVKGNGSYTLGPLPDPLPELPALDVTPYDNMLSDAASQPEGDVAFHNLDLAGETLLVNGKFVLENDGSITGPGTIVAIKGIEIKNRCSIVEDISLVSEKKVIIKEGTVFAGSINNVLFSSEAIIVEKHTQVSGALLSMQFLCISEYSEFTGVAYSASGEVMIKEAASIEGCVLAYTLKEVEKYVTVTYDVTIVGYIGKKVFMDAGGPAASPPVFPALINGMPGKVMLSQNYPNPFNPDTWIPYHLAEDVDVSIRIYDAAGHLIRTLGLGRKPAGFYTTKEEAAYWDGKNEAGEQVASGIYFYSVQAGDFTATKKMIMAK